MNFEIIKSTLEVEINRIIDGKHPEQYLEGWADGATYCLILITNEMLRDAILEQEERTGRRVNTN